MSIDISYTRAADGTHIAYRVLGEPGAVDIVIVAGAFFSLELLAEDRVTSRFLDGLAALGRVAMFDKRGVGSSDPLTDWDRSAQEQWADDLVAVVAAAQLDNPVVVSWEPFGVARRAAARHPELFSKLVLINPGPTTGFEVLDDLLAPDDASFEPRSVEEAAFPSRINDPDFQSWLVRAGRVGASPSLAPKLWAHVLGFDEGPLTPPGISTPTLILHNATSMVRREWVDTVADALEDAEVISVPGADAYPIAGDIDPLVTEIAAFLGQRSPLTSQRVIRAVVFTDLVGSTERAVQEGDAAWRALLEHHDGVVRQLVSRHHGEVVKFTGDGVLCLMPSVSAAITSATEIRDALAHADLTIRCGVHVGDVDERMGDVSGLTINVAARVMGLAPDSRVAVTTAVREAAAGSSARFTSLGEHELKGVDGRWMLHLLEDDD